MTILKSLMAFSMSCIVFSWAVRPAMAALIPAFPGAQGFGATTVGGRGGQVLIVDTLEDTVDASDGKLSLREAVQVKTGPRIVIFNVGGTIDLGSSDMLKIQGEPSAYLTIAGQTAPGGGILLKGRGIRLRDTHDVIIRYLRVRNIDAGQPKSEDDDTIQILGGVHDVVIDHNSLSWATDGIVDLYTDPGETIKNITLQWNILAEGDRDSTHSESGSTFGPHSTGMLLGARWDTDDQGPVAIHHNLFIHNNTRNPLFQRRIKASFVNNLIYNWGSDGTTIGIKNDVLIPRVDAINNYYKRGPNSITYALYGYSSSGGYGELYETGNKYEDRSGTVSNLQVSPQRSYLHLMTQPLLTSSVIPETAANAKNSVLALAGASLPTRDTIDTRLIQEYTNGTGMIGIDSDNTRRYPTLVSGTPPTDTDRDGMPDSWETARNLKPAVNDSAADRNSDGYTNLEEYINGLTDSTGPTSTSMPTPTPLAACRLDRNNDGVLNVLDLVALLENWQGAESMTDLLEILDKWGQSC